MSFFHVLFDRYSTEFLEHKKTYRPIISARNIATNNLLDQLEKGEISVQEYVKEQRENVSVSTTKLKAYTKKKNEIMENDKFFGRASIRYWLFFFGLVIAIGYFSIKSYIVDIKNENLKWHKYISVGGIIICCFWLYHLFFLTEKDFNKPTYFMLQVLCAVLVGVTVARLIKFYINKESLEQIISSLFRFINELDENDFIKEAKRKPFRVKKLRILKNVLK